jgi:uncharacterized protein (DUF885 family)
MLSRRELLATASLAAVANALPLAPFARADEQPSPEAAKLNALFDAFFQEQLQQNPEQATQLGLDKGADAALKSKLRDVSEHGIAAAKALNADQLRRLKTIDSTKLSPPERVNYDTVVYTHEALAVVQSFDFGGTSFGPSPYVVSQLTGSYQFVPDFLDTKHTIDSAADADAYLARLEAFGGQLDDDRDRMRHDSGEGIVPPDFLLDTSLAQMGKTRVPTDQSLLVTSIARRAKEKGLPDSYAKSAAKLYDEKVGPALDRLIAQTKTFRATAKHDAGLGQFKEGPAFYAAALHSTTTTDKTPDEIHKLGLDQAAEISARLDALLKGQGLTKGTVGERIRGLYQDPASFYPNTDAGKVDAIAFCNAQLASIRPQLPRVFKRLPNYQFEIRRVPPATEAGAASAFSQAPALDGSRPGIVYFNLHDTAEWPKWSLSTTVFHEALPGHQLEGGLALSNKNLPLIRKVGFFPGYGEGWALYAEQLADELGMYDNDPLGRIGYLKFQLFRAGRCVVDTGIHHLGWSREQAIAYFIALDGDAPGFATREVERYCATPGQACSYKIGHTVWVNARERAKSALGSRYDIKDFHEAGLDCGRVPLDILDTVIDRYIARTRSA